MIIRSVWLWKKKSIERTLGFSYLRSKENAIIIIYREFEKKRGL